MWAAVASEPQDLARAADSLKAEVIERSEIKAEADSMLSAGRHALSLRFEGRQLALIDSAHYEIRNLDVRGETDTGWIQRDDYRSTLEAGLPLGLLNPDRFERLGRHTKRGTR